MATTPLQAENTGWFEALRRSLLAEPLKALMAEAAKCRRTRIVLLALVPGAGLAGLKVLGFLLRGAEDLGPERCTWPFFLSIGADLWERLVLPFLAVSATAWTAWMENENNAWKVNFVQPVSRGALFASKFLLAAGLLALVELSWAVSHWAGGWLLQLPAPSLHKQLLARAGLMMASLAPLLALQHWIAYRSRSLALPLTVGLSGIVAGMVMASKPWAPLLPWTYPVLGGTRIAEALALAAAIFGLGLLSCSGLSVWTRRRPAAATSDHAVGESASQRERFPLGEASGQVLPAPGGSHSRENSAKSSSGSVAMNQEDPSRRPAASKMASPPQRGKMRASITGSFNPPPTANQARPRPQWMRLVQAEGLKLRRSTALTAALLAPLLFSGLVTIDFMTRSGIQESGLWTWATYFQTTRALWGVFGCALLAAVLAALWMGVEHRNDNWTLLLTQPLRPAGILLTKLAAVAGLAALSTAVLFLSALGGGVMAGLSGPVPWREAAVMAASVAALLPVVLLQCGLSLKFRSFLLPVGLGLMAHFGSAVAANVAVLGVRPGYYSPWAILLRALQVGGAERAASAFDLAAAGLMALGLLLFLPRLTPARA